MEFRYLQYFLKIAQCSSISQAAKELFISQQALSKALKNLEQELGARLLHRTNQGVQLTPEGAYLRDHFQHIVSEYDDALRETYQHFGAQRGRIEFGVSPGFFRSLSNESLIAFAAQHPYLELDQLEKPDLDLEDYVREDRQHFAFSTKPWQMQGLQYCPIHREKLYFIADKTHPLAARPEIRLADLKDERFLFFTSRYNIYHRTEACCKRAGFAPHIVYKSSDVNVLVKMVAQGRGILLCVRHVYEEYARENLVCIPLADEEMYWELGLIMQDYHALDPNARLLIRAFEAGTPAAP